MTREFIESGAEFSPMRTHRHRLWRIWKTERPRLGAVLLNPSTADEKEPDPTLSKLVGFADRWGFGGVILTNLFDIVSTDPDQLCKPGLQLTSEQADFHIAQTAASCGTMLFAWGNGPNDKFRETMLTPRAKHVEAIVRKNEAFVICFGLTGKQQPKHPLYISYEAKPSELR